MQNNQLTSIIFGHIRELTAASTLSIVSLSAFSLQADEYYTVNFEELYASEEKEEILSADHLKEYINSTMGIDFIEAVTYCEENYAFKSGLGVNVNYDSTNGALFIYSNSEEENEEIGGFTFTINPKYWQNVEKINFVTYKNPNNFGSGSNIVPTEIEVAVNGNNYNTYTSTSSRIKETISVEIPENQRIVKQLSVRVPNVVPKALYRYFIGLTKFTFVYQPVVATKISEWRFEETSVTAYLNDEQKVTLPELIASPIEAAEFASLSSSNQNVAEIVNGDIEIRGEGTATITASLQENSLYTSSLPSATYELKVLKNPSTVVSFPVISEGKEAFRLYDLQGREISGKPAPGIYIKKEGDKSSKVVVR